MERASRELVALVVTRLQKALGVAPSDAAAAAAIEAEVLSFLRSGEQADEAAVAALEGRLRARLAGRGGGAAPTGCAAGAARHPSQIETAASHCCSKSWSMA
jgi:hypothetical protein